MVKGMPLVDPEAADDGVADLSDSSPGAPIDLGPSGPETTLRPMQRVAVAERPAATDRTAAAAAGPRPWWRDPRVLAVVAGAALLVVGAVLFATRDGGAAEPAAPKAQAVAAKATQQDQPAPTGLTISRSASYDPQSRTVELTVTYAAQNAALTGPFLEVIPGRGGTCPSPEWDGAQQEANLPSSTGVTTACAWSVDPGQVPAQGNVSVTARVPLTFDDADPTSALQSWLDDAAAKTTAAVGDPQLNSTAYPVQRLQGIDIVAPARTVSQSTLRLGVFPVWPSGKDALNPLYRSPSVGDPSSLLTAVAGGEQGVRFSDGCSGALAVSSDGLVVTALTVTPECHVAAQIGNFTNLSSNSFAIVTRGG